MNLPPTSARINDPRLPKNFWAKVYPSESGCWLWGGGISKGYGMFNPRGSATPVGAHRHAYEALVGPIAQGLHCDHLCRNPPCVNPSHIEPVTQRENNLRGIGAPAINAKKTECKHGHPLAGENLHVNALGQRTCITCKRAESRNRLRRWRSTPEGRYLSRLWNRESMRRKAAERRAMAKPAGDVQNPLSEQGKHPLFVAAEDPAREGSDQIRSQSDTALR